MVRPGQAIRLMMPTLLTAALVLLASCQSRKTDESPKQSSPSAATGAGAGGAVKAQPEAKASAARWPDDMPADVPRFTMGKITGVGDRMTGGRKSWNVFVADVADGSLGKYTEELKGKGWRILMSVPQGGGGTVLATKNDLAITLIFYSASKTGSIGVNYANTR